MPTWSEIGKEINVTTAELGAPSIDIIRRKYLEKLHKHTKRNVILYASAWCQKPNSPPGLLTIIDEDMQGIMEVIHGLEKIPTDLILHSPGGSPEAAEGIVNYLHAQFPEIRVIIPHLAMSAATMIACSSSEIIMGKHSSIGPVDPQIIITNPNPNHPQTSNPAQAIIDQFYLALKEVNDFDKRSWAILLEHYGPSLIIQCKNYIDMSKTLVKEWLLKYMFNTNPKKISLAQKEKNEALANDISTYLSNHDEFKSHGRHISREKAKAIGLYIRNLEDDDIMQDLVLSIFHATTLTFGMSYACKIIENHIGKAFVKIAPLA
ncbi:MAG: Serine protease [Ignavibacteria bacterium]|nr:Serine protease [Ignavibacteria bacterium]